MNSASPAPSLNLPDWPHCGHGADSEAEPVGCRGIRVPGHAACLAHLSETDRSTYLVGLQPGADLDHRGTPFTEELLRDLLTALTNPGTQWPSMGQVQFEEAKFSGNARFGQVKITGDALFDRVEIDRSAISRGQ